MRRAPEASRVSRPDFPDLEKRGAWGSSAFPQGKPLRPIAKFVRVVIIVVNDVLFIAGRIQTSGIDLGGGKTRQQVRQK
jgi:hypothetical protein